MPHQVRQRLEEKEERLSPWAARSRLSLGRSRTEPPCPWRTAFQRDRDRILYSNAFRRLKHKTQVFIAPLGDHYVTRLTHTLEVAQIDRTIARALNLNEDLTEAIALGHDLGHTPFGHVGEEVLNELQGFSHSKQSLRVVDVLENEGQGLNLSHEVRMGILSHSKPKEAMLVQGSTEETVESQIVRLADSVAYINHDTADAIRAGLITEKELPSHTIAILGSTPSQRINAIVADIVRSSWAATAEVSVERPLIQMSTPMLAAAEELRQFLFDKVYDVCARSQEAIQAREIVRLLYRHFINHPQALPQELSQRQEPLERVTMDYIAGMTDRFAMHLAREIPQGIPLSSS
ncbi:MAG: deoxyguanosinetriphosphate triphosphohydrolase [Chloroflexota bacterium]